MEVIYSTLLTLNCVKAHHVVKGNDYKSNPGKQFQNCIPGFFISFRFRFETEGAALCDHVAVHRLFRLVFIQLKNQTEER